MQQEGAGPTLRPLGVGEILDVAIKIYTRNLATFIALVAIVVVPIGLLTILGYVSLIPDGAFIRDESLYFPLTESTTAYNTFYFVTIGLSLLATLIATGVGTRAVADAYLGRKPSVGGSYAYVGRRFHSLLWISFLTVLVVALGFIALIIPGIYLGVALIATVPVLVVEGLKGTKAIGRSFTLVQGRWWSTFGTILLGVVLIPGVINFAFGFLIGLGASSDDPTTYLVLAQAAATIGEVVSTPIQVAVITVLYFDLRVRKEAFDIQLLADRVDALPGSAPSSLPPTAGPTTPPPTSETPPPPSG